MTDLLTLTDVSAIGYGETVVLDRVSLSVAPGTTLAGISAVTSSRTLTLLAHPRSHNVA